jgi:hypothetical protein
MLEPEAKPYLPPAESERIGARVHGDAIGAAAVIMAAVVLILAWSGVWHF